MSHGLNHHAEDVVEENGEERIAHEAFYSAVDPDYRAIKEPFVPPTVQAAKANSKFSTMAVVPGTCVRGFLDVSSLILCVAVMIIQHGLIDYYYISVLKDSIWYAWLGGDVLVLAVCIWACLMAVKRNQQSMEETCSIDARVRYAWIAWLFYSALLVGKIATCFRLFYTQLPPKSVEINNDGKLFDDHLLRLALCLSAVVFVFLLEANHYTPLASPRQLYITYLMTAICFDLLDAVAFLDLLWQAEASMWTMPLWLELCILCIGCFNFVLPTFALLKLRFNRNQRVLMISDRVWAFFYVLLVNAPFLGFRIYLFIIHKTQEDKKKYDASIFAIKNVVVIYIALRELWVRLQYFRQKRAALGSRGELTAQGATDHEDN